MKIKILSFLFVMFLCSQFITGQDIAGDWNGLLELQGMQLRLVLHVNVNEDSLSATLDSPDQGVSGINVDNVAFEGLNFKMNIDRLMLNYEARINESADSLVGTFSQGGINIPLTMIREEIEEPIVNRPQEPSPPFPYSVTDVKFENKSAGIKLAGTMTIPQSSDLLPAVIMISGSGPQDRDEALMGHKPFHVIADHFSRNGIAVLRFDDRGVAESEGDFQASTSADFATDVSAAVDFLQTMEGIDKMKIGLVGHSEGGLIAPMIAAEREDLDFIILMAGPGINGKEILLKQSALMSRAGGASEDDITEQIEVLAEAFEIIDNTQDTALAANKLSKLISSVLDGLTEEEQAEIGDSESFIETQVNQLNSPWFRYFLHYEPSNSLIKVTCPVLAINGSLDLQVPSRENLEAINNYLREGGNTNVEIVEIPNLNHLFQTAETGHISEYATIEETFSPIALNIMSEWIKKIVEE